MIINRYLLIYSPIFFNYNEFASFYTHFYSFNFCLIICTIHVSFEALNSGFEVVLVNDTTTNGVAKSQFFPTNFPRKNFQKYGLPLLC